MINTPVEQKSSVIEPHLDNPIEFYAGLLYMRNKDDNSVGSNLCTYEFKKDPIFYGKSRVKDENVNLVEEIEYKPNRLVCFNRYILCMESLKKMFPDIIENT